MPIGRQVDTCSFSSIWQFIENLLHTSMYANWLHYCRLSGTNYLHLHNYIFESKLPTSMIRLDDPMYHWVGVMFCQHLDCFYKSVFLSFKSRKLLDWTRIFVFQQSQCKLKRMFEHFKPLNIDPVNKLKCWCYLT